jgi:hypothetical protein
MKLQLTILAIFLFSLTSLADTYDDGLNGSIQYQRSLISDFAQGQLSTRTQEALNSVIEAANTALRENGYPLEADAFQMEWNGNFSTYFTSFQTDDLGDHQPLNAWLDNYYKQAQDRLGDPVMKLLHLDDIFVLNYSIPVVFHPKGDVKGQDHWNALEYQRHFVPFATVTTFWGSLGACQLAAMKVAGVKRWCGSISTILRGVMKNTVAPKLSGVVYKKFTTGESQNLDLDLADIEKSLRDEAAKIHKN